MTVDEFFFGQPESRLVFDACREAIEEIGPAELRVTRSQVAFRRRRPFAWVWIPEMYLHRKCPPLVLTLPFRYRHSSPRWKQIVEPRPGRFTHHLELNSPEEIDDEVKSWLAAAWAEAE